MNVNKTSPPVHQPKNRMKVDAAIAYLAERGVPISRRSFYNWVKLGVRGTRLEHSTIPNPVITAKDREIIVVSREQIESFLATIGVRGCRMT